MRRSILPAVIILVPAAGARADTIHVPAEFASVQAAIDAAADGDHVLVAPGLYMEAIDLRGKAITVRSSGGAAATTLDGSGPIRSVVTCASGEGADTVLEGFTITGGGGTLVNSRYEGGGMYNLNSDPTVRDCVFTGNVIVAYTFGIEGSGGGMFNEGGRPTVIGCVFRENELLGCSGWLNGGGGMFNNDANPLIVDCAFIDNFGNNGGGMMSVNGSRPKVFNGTFIGNEVTYSGGASNATEAAAVTLVNCRISGNRAFHGAGVYSTSSTTSMSSCTVTRNSAEAVGAGMYTMFSTTPSPVSNSIFWGNDATEDPAQSEIAHYGGFPPAVMHSLVEGGYEGDGNLDGDPRFADEAGPDGVPGTLDDDLHLQDDSPAVDAGDTDAMPADSADLDGDGDMAEPLPLDLDGGPRASGMSVDLGVFEISSGAPDCPADGDGDGFVGLSDLVSVLSDWGACPVEGPCAGDLDGDDSVGFIDLTMVLSAWGPCP